MPNNGDLTGSISLKEKRKIFFGKCIMGALIVGVLIPLVSSKNASLSSNLLDINSLFTAFFGYLNLANIKSELMELFEPPYPFIGAEFVIVSFFCSTISFFV